MRSHRSRFHVAGLALLATTAAAQLDARELSCTTPPQLEGNQWAAVFPCTSDECENESGGSNPFPGTGTSPGPISPRSPYVNPGRIEGLKEVLQELKMQPSVPMPTEPGAPKPGAGKPGASKPGTAKANPGEGLPESQNVYYATYILEQFESPSPASLSCEGMGNWILCEAFPQGDNLTYSWSTTGKAYMSGWNDPTSPMKSLSCNGVGSGSVTVTVYSPYGVTATASRNVYCGY